MHESLERFEVVSRGGMLKRIEMGFSIFRADRNGRVSSSKQKQVHQQPCRASVAVSERINGDQSEMRVKAGRRYRLGLAKPS
jgi:hypothetical protein